MFTEYLELKQRETEASGWDETIPKEKEVSSNLSKDLDLNKPPETTQSKPPLEGKGIFLLDSLLSPNECKRIIETTEAFGYGRTDFVKHYRGNTRLMCKDSDFAEKMFQRIAPFVPSQLSEHHGEDLDFKVVGLNNTFRLSKYSHGDLFKPHIDACFQKELGEDKHIEKSMYTFNLYLNDDFEAGHTRFFVSRNDQTVEASITPETGLCLLFRQPPHSHYLHDGEAVVRGYKYLLRSDVIYRSTTPSTIFMHIPPPPQPMKPADMIWSYLLYVCQIVIQFFFPTKFPRSKET